MKLLITRHGETEWNVLRRYQGQSDVPLNEKGIWQAEQLAKRLAAENISAIYASDLSRAVDTARTILHAQTGGMAISITTDPRWRELSFGKWEGLNHEEISTQWQAEAQVWYADQVNSSPPGGESLLQLAERVESALDGIRRAHKDETVLLVSHSGALQALMCHILGVDLKRYWQFRILQASLSIVSFYEDSAVLNLFNDISHLRET